MSIAAIPDADINQAAQIFKLAAEPVRLKVILALSEGEANVSALCERFGVEQPTLSHHLCLLKLSGVVECRRDGKFNIYSLCDKGRALVGVFNSVAF